MRKRTVLGIVVVCAALFAGGCSKGFNAFAPLTPSLKDQPKTLENAANAYASGDYVTAMEQYEQLMKDNPGSSEAKYGYVKAYVKNAGFDISTFIKNGTGNSSPALFAPAVSKGPILDDRYNPFGVNVLGMERICATIISCLRPIAEGLCTDGYVPANDVSVNATLGFALLLNGVFNIVDPGLDGSVDYNFYDFGGGTVKVVYYGTTTQVPTGLFPLYKAWATGYLTDSIKYIHVASVTSGGGSIWTDVEAFLTDVKTTINNL